MGFIAAVGQRGQTITQPGGGGGGQAYGPTDGRDAVIAAAAPRTVSTPGGAITFTSAPDLQAKIDANATGSSFVPSAGWSDWSQRVLPNGKNPKVYVPPARLVPESSTLPDVTYFAMIGGDGMEIYGGTWQNCGATGSGGTGNCIQVGLNSIAEDVIATDAYLAGIKITGNGAQVRYAKVHDNGLDGINSSSGADNCLVQHVELFGNGYRNPDDVPDHGGSGKWTSGTSNNIMEYLYVHEAFDYGPWVDGGGHMTFRESVVEDCRKAGFFFEIMTSGGEISRNWLARNGEVVTGGEWFFANVFTVACCDTAVGSQILISRNHVEGAERLLAINNQDGRANTRRVKVFDNRFKFTNSAARLGGQDSQLSGSRTLHLQTPSNGGTCEFDRNLYQCQGTLFTFTRWPTSSTDAGSDQTWAQWQALGFDLNSTREVV